MRKTEPQHIDQNSPTDAETLNGRWSELDRALYSPDYATFVAGIVQTKEACFALIDKSQSRDYWWQMVQFIEEEIEFNDEASWDEIMGTIYPMMTGILEHRYNGIAFIRDDEVQIAEFIHRYAIYSYLESSQNDLERSERMENLLGTTQNIFLEGHHNVEQLRGNPAIIDYQAGYESFLSILTACKKPEEVKNAVIALFEVSPGVDWERERNEQTLFGAMAKHQMEKGDYLYDDDYQNINAYTETAQVALSVLIRSGAELSEPEMDLLVNMVINSTEKHYLPQIAELASNNPGMAVKVLLSILQNPKSHEVQRHISLSLLYRIELGRIGISEDGVEYLTRKFDLGEYNNPDYSVLRGSSQGDMLVFDEKGTIKGFFKLEMSDFTGDETTIQKKLQQITIDILFTPQADETPEERQYKLQLVEEFKNNYLSTYKELFPEGNGQIPFHFNGLSLPEQGFVLKFLNSHQEDDPLRQKFFSVTLWEQTPRLQSILLR